MSRSSIGHWVVTGFLLLPLVGGGCESSDGGANQTGMDAAVQRDAAPQQVDAAPQQVDAAPQQVDAAPQAQDGSTTGACSAADEAIIDGATFKDDLSSCAMSCAFGSDPNCNQTCIEDDTGLSTGCSECFAGNLQCTMDNCLSDCASDSSSPGCMNCMEQAGCISALTTCSGLEP